MPPTFVHFETLRERVASHPDTPIFKLPKAGGLHEWVDVSYTRFQADIERMARFWLSKLSANDIPTRSVVGIWLRGFTYQDAVTTFAVSRAGFIPQMFGFELPNTRIVFELLAKTDGKAIIHDLAKTALLAEYKTALPCHIAVEYTTVSQADVARLPLPDLPEVDAEDWTFIYHSSGSVSGMPKVVPKTNKWLSTIRRKNLNSTFSRSEFEPQDVFVWTESFSHSVSLNRKSTSHLFQLILHCAGCLIQPSRVDFDSSELAGMIRNAGANRIIQFSSVLRMHLEDARAEPELLALLKTARQVTYMGMPLASELEDWAVAEGVPITASSHPALNIQVLNLLQNRFGSTECGQLLTSMVGDRRLEMLPGIEYKFEPVGQTSINGTEYERLLELWILPGSPDLPVPALRTPDGGWRSGDLFEEVGVGKYLFRGRDDDWIKSQWSERLDTKSIENNMYTTCSDIVGNCVVGANSEELKREIIKRTSDFHSLRYLHERIVDPRIIKIVPPKTLPRTAAKGNIRRRAVELEYADELEAMYASIPVEEVFVSVFGVEGPKAGAGMGTDSSDCDCDPAQRMPAAA